jgi:protein-tyrosine phosphatase
MTTDGTVLCLCTANMCRSPLMAAALGSRLAPGIEVRSAGTRAADGRPVAPDTLAAARSVGLDLRGHRSARPHPGLLDDADLIVTATREQRAAVARLQPRAARKAFTWHQLLRLAEAVTADDLRRAHALVASGLSPVTAGTTVLSSLRGHVAPPADPSLDDLRDPFGESVAAQTRVARHVVDGAGRLAVVLDAVRAGDRHAAA